MPRVETIPIEKRIKDKVVVDEHGCWIWQGKPDVGGYGQICYLSKQRQAHRLSYELFIGPIPDGLDIDHLCRVRLCVNPEHLEPVTRRENLIRGVHPNMVLAVAGKCKQGHDVDENNSYRRSDGRLGCRICMKGYKRKYYEASR